MACVALHPSGFKANYMDLSRGSAGMLSGVGNTLASVASYGGPLAVGFILETSGSWPTVFGAVCAVNVLAAGVYGCFSRVTPLDDGPAKDL